MRAPTNHDVVFDNYILSAARMLPRLSKNCSSMVTHWSDIRTVLRRNPFLPIFAPNNRQTITSSDRMVAGKDELTPAKPSPQDHPKARATTLVPRLIVGCKSIQNVHPPSIKDCDRIHVAIVGIVGAKLSLPTEILRHRVGIPIRVGFSAVLPAAVELHGAADGGLPFFGIVTI